MTFSEQSGVFGLFVADHVDAMLAYWDKDMVCRFVNKAYTDWFGKTREELVGKYTIPQLLGPLYNNRKSFIDAVLAGESQKFEGEQINAKGEIGNLLISYHPDVENGTVKGFFVHCVNISSAKSLETTSQMYASIVNSTSDGIISKRTDGTIVTWNKGAERILGYSAAEAEGKNISLIFPPYLQHEEQQLVARVQSGAPVEQYETLRQHKDGRLVNVSITLSPVRDSMDNITAITNVMRDITLHKLAEEEARRSNERNRIFVQQAPNALAMVDKDMRYLAASARWMKDYGLGEKDIIGKSHYEVFPEIGEDWKQIHRDCLAGATNQCDEAPFERADGTVQWLQWDVRPWYQTENEIGGLLMYTADITHIKDKENERKRIQHILEKTNQVARIAHWEIDVRTNRATWSPIANEILELPAAYTPDAASWLAMHQRDNNMDALLAAVRKTTEEGVPYDEEIEIMTISGHRRWLRIIGEAEFRKGVCVRRFGIIQDITRSKETASQLNRLNEELQAILNSGHVSIISTDCAGVITHFNQGAEIMLGYTATEVVGIHTPQLIHVAEEVAQRGVELSQQFGRTIEGFDVFVEMARQGKYDSRNWTYVRKNGSTFPVQLVETAIRNSEGNISGFLGVATDITELKNAERETTTLLEITKDQNERLKNFAHIVSHNLRSHSGNMEMLLSLFANSDPVLAGNEYVQLLLKASDNLKGTIADLNEVAQINLSTEGRLVPVNLHQRIEAARYNVFQLAREGGVTIYNDVPAHLMVAGLPAYIDSILLNFITNSIKYRADRTDSYVRLSATVEQDNVILAVADNGLGIDLKRHRAKLFGMYKTFHHVKDSRGIGLFITKNQVEALGGKIDVTSEPGVGTTFKIYLKHEKH